ncbi:glycerol-3-phosphate 1-O-acyltransferase PlsY, partial [Campylobacter coli]|nr:glycerol-3-phosphate 1-O-acyltransferase PlsY [Campylobacter coli]
MENLIIYAIAYLLGSIPFGLILAKQFAQINIQNQGSKSIGATNVLRVVKEKDPALAKKLAIATIVLDFAKATIPLLVLKFLNYDLNLLWTVAVLTVFGHCFSIYLLFEGGKGVATGAGAMIVLLPLELITAFIVWFIVGKIFKISSLASLLALLV